MKQWGKLVVFLIFSDFFFRYFFKKLDTVDIWNHLLEFVVFV